MTPEPTPSSPGPVLVAAAVAVGGAMGAVLRWLVQGASVALLDAEPVGTLAVNVAGCLAMGVLVARILAGAVRHPLARPLLGTGVLGGFTTFSAFAADGVVLARDGATGSAVAYVVATLVLCLAAVWVGGMVGRGTASGRWR